MLIDPQDHQSHEERISGSEGQRTLSRSIAVAAVAIIAVAGIGAGFYFSTQKSTPPFLDKSAPVVAPLPVPKVPAAPDIPDPAPTPAPELLREAVPAEPEITIQNSDQELRNLLATAGATPLVTQVLEANDLVQRGAGMIDGFSRGLVPRKALPLAPPKKAFSTVKTDGLTYIDPASYTRYDSYVQAIASLDVNLLVSIFHRYRTLLEQAYAGFGYSGEDMDNALIRSLDYILATPEPSEPLALQRKEAIFQYLDPKFEQLTASQKQLLRMGPENFAKIKQQARALRQGLLGVSQ
ncbi:MAG TPA: DUF3014 domain-containing protein [Halieaceae bacterium]|nr:MAG: hypothetical protein DRQ98_10660 [Gammaproteobacteria bacterium]HDY83400.1 DUF3014 domain-containing protein [Halieaceae bacterium]